MEVYIRELLKEAGDKSLRRIEQEVQLLKNSIWNRDLSKQRKSLQGAIGQGLDGALIAPALVVGAADHAVPRVLRVLLLVLSILRPRKKILDLVSLKILDRFPEQLAQVHEHAIPKLLGKLF